MPASKIPLTPVQSSQLAAVGYDHTTGTLAIQFKGKGGAGSTYEYANVPQDVYEGLRTADSCGKFFGEHIKGEFSFAKMVADDAE